MGGREGREEGREGGRRGGKEIEEREGGERGRKRRVINKWEQGLTSGVKLYKLHIFIS